MHIQKNVQTPYVQSYAAHDLVLCLYKSSFGFLVGVLSRLLLSVIPDKNQIKSSKMVSFRMLFFVLIKQASLIVVILSYYIGIIVPISFIIGRIVSIKPYISSGKLTSVTDNANDSRNNVRYSNTYTNSDTNNNIRTNNNSNSNSYNNSNTGITDNNKSIIGPTKLMYNSGLANFREKSRIIQN